MKMESEKSSKPEFIEKVQEPVSWWRRYLSGAGTIVSKRWRKYRTNIFLGYLVAAIIIFVILAVLARTVAYFAFDVTITHAVQGIRLAWFAGFLYALSWIGFTPQAYLVSLIFILLLYASGLKWETMVSVVSLILISAIGLGIKLLIDRPRPSANLVTVLSQLKDYSFPSGHVLYFSAFFGFLLFLTFTLLKHSWVRTILLILLGIMIAFIGISRIYEGEHWASDVIGAYLLGSVWLSITILVYRWGKPRFSANQPVAKESPTQKR
jgi:membrane-associated phospholipid phosphatase